jgi:hypothetical protein
MAVIRLGPSLPVGSSHLPADLASSLGYFLASAYLVLLRMEVAAFHPLAFDGKRLVSVALFLAFIHRANGDL